MPERSSIESRLILTLAVIGIVAVAGVLAILPYRLWERDIRRASLEAHRVSAVVQAALRCPLSNESNAGDLVERMQGAANVQIALARLEAGEVRPGAMAGRGSSLLDDTELRYVSTPVLDPEGNAWVAEMLFDLSPMKRESVRLIVDLVVAVGVGALLFSWVIFVLFRRAFVLPLRELTRCIEREAAGDRDVRYPRFENTEMRELATAVTRVASRQA